jgi:diaminohydroxyphosphoribosylaminopyrimidine deaminase/5-amino-6-(5-phosphoribosylamino)uracil reductase
LLDAGQLDEVHVFIAPKLFGGQKARSPTRGAGVERVNEALALVNPRITALGQDVYVSGRIQRAS